MPTGKLRCSMSIPVTLVETDPWPFTVLRCTAHLVRDQGPPAPFGLSLRYSVHDPFAVRVLLEAGTAAVTWTLSRDLLLRSLLGRDGMGDVAAWPVARGLGADVVQVRLGPPGGGAVIEIAHDVLSRWLEVTRRLSPVGEESRHIDWDAVTRVLLDADTG
ncbi:SsgA family sporulation/cell division regulator [Streptomyces sp. p1417]|uniref:SsgA family sporulation/cell division regulator n=1 Tax=Streptomyces typhae TaxID=2681492 RepID=A0A6L6XAC7_9ACTN|nr:SsgA family sporulation/cell division regulator [Streptomyces typhae]MVO90852.1 SsgA family sporulation/cell division regulator [Streptomyces typhae]